MVKGEEHILSDWNSSLFLCLRVSVWPADTLSCQDRLRLLGAGSRDQDWHSGIGVPCLVYHPSWESPQPQWCTANQVGLQHTNTLKLLYICTNTNCTVRHMLLCWTPFTYSTLLLCVTLSTSLSCVFFFNSLHIKCQVKAAPLQYLTHPGRGEVG